MAQKVVLYSKYDCVQCKMTKRLLDSLGIAYQEINLDESPQFREHVANNLGFIAAPVIETDTSAWSGFQPGKIKAIKKQLATKAGFLLDKIKCLC